MLGGDVLVWWWNEFLHLLGLGAVLGQFVLLLGCACRAGMDAWLHLPLRCISSWQASSDQSTFHCLEIARAARSQVLASLWALVAYVAFAGAGSICSG